MGTTNILDLNNRVDNLEKSMTSVEDAVDRITQPGITAERVDISAFNTQSNPYACPADGYVYIQGASETAANLKLLFADESSFYTILNTNTDIIPVYVRKGAKVFCTNPTQCYFVAL